MKHRNRFKKGLGKFQFIDKFGNKQNFNWYQINCKSVCTIQNFI